MLVGCTTTWKGQGLGQTEAPTTITVVGIDIGWHEQIDDKTALPVPSTCFVAVPVAKQQASQDRE